MQTLFDGYLRDVRNNFSQKAQMKMESRKKGQKGCWGWAEGDRVRERKGGEEKEGLDRNER